MKKPAEKQQNYSISMLIKTEPRDKSKGSAHLGLSALAAAGGAGRLVVPVGAVGVGLAPVDAVRRPVRGQRLPPVPLDRALLGHADLAAVALPLVRLPLLGAVQHGAVGPLAGDLQRRVALALGAAVDGPGGAARAVDAVAEEAHLRGELLVDLVVAVQADALRAALSAGQPLQPLLARQHGAGPPEAGKRGRTK